MPKPPEQARVLARRQRTIERLQRRARRISRTLLYARFVRVASFLTIFALPLLAFATFAIERGGPLALLALPGLLAFAGALAWSRRLERALSAGSIQSELHGDARARLLGNWDRTVRAAQEAGPDALAHAYVGDLEVFGPFSLFRLLDRTSTKGGRRKLSELLAGVCNPEHRSGHPDFDQLVCATSELQRARVFTERFRRVGAGLARPNGERALNTERVRELAALAVPAVPRLLPWLSRALAAVSIGSYVAFSMGIGQAYFLLSIPAQLGLFAVMHFYARATSQALHALADDLVGYEKLFGISGRLRSQAPLLQGLSILTPAPQRTLNRLSWIASLFALRRNPIAHLAAGILLGYEVELLHALARTLVPEQQNMAGWLDELSFLDCLLAIAQYRSDRPGYVQPELLPDDDERVLQANAVRHPLFEPHPDGHVSVANNFELRADTPIWIVSGSNMSGKSTFLRTLGSCLILARIGATVPATRFAFQQLYLVTSMQQHDDLRRSVSLFYAEVKRVKLVLDCAAKHGGRLLFLIDEMLRGTNSRERQLAVRSVIATLRDSGSCGLVTTHDLDLLAEVCESDGFACAHFQEVVANGRMSFDYMLRPGPVRTSNALRILEQEGIHVTRPG